MKKYKEIGFLVLAAFVFGSLMWFRCAYGGLVHDESYTWAQCMRFLQGDIPFRHDWSPHLLSTMFLTPVYSLWCVLGMEPQGLILFTRRAFVVLWVIYLVFLYVRWARVNKVGACLGVLAIAFVPPRYLYSINYNSMSFMGVLAFVTFLMTPSWHRCADVFYAGVSLAIAILGVPHLFLLYVAYSVAGIRRSVKEWLILTSGCFSIACLFGIELLKMTTIQDVFQFLPYILNNSEHTKPGMLHYVKHPVVMALFMFVKWWLGLIYFVALGTVMLDRHPEKRGRMYLIIFVLITLVAFALFAVYIDANTLNTMLCFLPMFMIAVGLIYRKHIDTRMLMCALGVSVLFALIFMFASNTQVRAVANGLGVAILPGVALVWQMISKKQGGGTRIQARYLKICFIVLLSAHFIVEFFVGSWREMAGSYVTATSGAIAGLKMPRDTLECYSRLQADVKEQMITCNASSVFVVENYRVFPYLTAQCHVAAPSPWCEVVSSAMFDRMQEYWRLNPDKKPDLIIVDQLQKRKFTGLFELSDMAQTYERRVLPSGNEAWVCKPI